MGWAIRAATAEDVPALVATDWAAFGNQPADVHVEGARAFIEVERMFVAVDRDRIVGTGGALSLELTVPGPATVPTAGVTYVGVLPTHRRQGILTALMAHIAEAARERGEPLAALLASESTIYRRFGFGVAVSNGDVDIERPHAQLRRPADIAGRTRLLDPAETAGVLPALYDAYRRVQPGEVSRTPGWWERRLADPPADRRGASGRWAVAYEDPPGCPAGYLTYRINQNWDGGLPSHVLAVEDLVATRPEVRSGLWQYCVDLDLVKTIRLGAVSVHDPLRWMLADPRRLRTTFVNDFLWVQLVDVAGALAARTYASDARLVVELVGGGGRYLLAGGSGGPAVCRRTDALPDVALEAADLASAYLGGAAFATLARAGLVDELTPGALARADSLFAAGAGPSSCTGF